MYKNTDIILARFLESSGVSIDTRTLKKGELFFAIVGENFDGNNYAIKALELGASYAIISNPKIEHPNCILVRDGLESLQKLAKDYRNMLEFPIIALTGSNGKTTTKELLHEVLSQQYQVMSTKGNLNNHIGVPLTLLSFPQSLDFGIVEMGANHLKEIAFYCTIAKPTHGFITNIGKAHIGEFGGHENLLKAKSELLDYLIETEGVVFYNNDVKAIQNRIENYEKLVEIGHKLPNEFLLAIKQSNPSIEYEIKNDVGEVFKGTSALGGLYNFQNIKMAIGIGLYFDIRVDSVIHGIKQYLPNNNRSQWITTNSNKVFLDAYNANPTSVKHAVNYFLLLDAKKKYIIIGDMLELGQHAEKEHLAIYEMLKNNDKIIDYFFLIGKNFNKIADKAHCFLTKDDLLQQLQTHRIENAHVLVKGSRSMKMESLISHL